MGAFAVFVCVGLIVLLMVVGLSSPETSVYAGNQVPASYITTAREVGALGPNETPKFFYSDGLMGIKSGFYLVTNTNVAIYAEDGRETPLSVIPLKTVIDAQLDRDESFLEDSWISLETKAGDYYTFPVSSEFDRDELFFEAIQSNMTVR